MSGLGLLKEGDAIGIYSPSSPITYKSPRRFERAKQFLEGKGFRIIEGTLTGKHDYYRSGSIAQRAEELNQLIRDPNVKCIMSTIGGMNSNSLLPYIDYEAFAKNPKIMIGYSDATAILLGIYAKTGVRTFYGPALVASYGELPPFVDDTYAYMSELLMKPFTDSHVMSKPAIWTDEYINWEEQDRAKEARKNDWIIINQGKAEGRLIGGNLNTMQGIWGSEYMPEIEEGDILLIEDSLKDAATIERSFSFLKINGVFEKVSGILLGKHELFNDMGTNRKPYEILLEVLGSPKMPIIADFDCCHTHPMLTMPIGVPVSMDTATQKIKLLKDWR